jgi:GNAT superfamily N-acetyltransferase
MENKILIRKGVKSDLPQVLELIRELAVFEKNPDEVTNTLSSLEEDGFGDKPVYGLFVAELNGKISGMALYFTKYSTWKGKGIYLDDLIVTERHRGKGIGKKLLDAVIEEAKVSGAKQLHWQVLDWNTPAIEFYKKIGVSIEAEWHDCKLTEKQIREYRP